MLMTPSCASRLCAAVVLIAASASSARAASIRLAWDPNPDPAVAGYAISYGTSSGQYSNRVIVGNQTSWEVIGLTDGTRYYFAVQAYNASAIWSPLSSEVVADTIRVGYGGNPGILASVNFPAPAGIPITWTTLTQSTDALQYKFWRFDGVTAAWSLVQDYSTNPSYTWVTGRNDEGGHAVQVWVRRAYSTAVYEAWQSTGVFSLTAAIAPVANTLTASETLPAPAGRTVTWTATAAGGVWPLQYKFWDYDAAAAAWSLVQDYSPRPTYTWTTAVADQGDHALQVWIRSVDSIAAYEAWQGTGIFSLSSPRPLVATRLAANVSLPAPAGTEITWAAATSGGIGPLQHQFWRYDAATAAWRVVQDYGSSDHYTWVTTAADVGLHALQVWVRNAGSTAPYDAWQATGIFQVTAPPTVQIAGLLADRALPAPTGQPITWLASAAGGTGVLEFKFWRYDADVDAWSIAQDYGPSASYTWITSTADIGLHAVQVWVRSVGSNTIYDAWAGSGLFTINR